MFIEFAPEERDELIQLVEARVREMAPEIRRSRTSQFRDQLQQKQHRLQRILHRLHESTWDVMA